ncbi:hypothetical protein GCM10010123_01630 [Pilimelia anulata]|uniref:XRE family transcriptional regulator n=1 Tax=Pilimelia anulata TaxID=53371 RepID=A0A8J3AYI2_9ACTN|nr:hypothetical protein GCM10010123_01630 [Pilimelia anulata]
MREGYRAVLGAACDADLGFYGGRRPRRAVVDEGQSLCGLGGEDEQMRRRALLMSLAAGGGAAAAPGLLRLAAGDSLRLAEAAHQDQPVSTDLQALRTDLRRAADDYVATSDVGRGIVDAVVLRDRVAAQIESGRQHPRTAADLYVTMSATCLLLASLSHDVGEPEAGMAQARSAESFAAMAGHTGLRSWALCTKAMIDLWRGHTEAVLAHAAEGNDVAVGGDGHRRLRGLQVRALAQLGRRDEARALLRTEPPPRSPVGALAEFGGLFSFPHHRQLYYRAVSYAHLGDQGAVEETMAALGYGQSAPAGGSWPVSWALGRGYLAIARLDSTGGGPEGAVEAVRPVLEMPKQQRIKQVHQVLGEVTARLRAGRHATSRSGRELTEAIRSFRQEATA